jgi:hypothetical protein
MLRIGPRAFVGRGDSSTAQACTDDIDNDWPADASDGKEYPDMLAPKMPEV